MAFVTKENYYNDFKKIYYLDNTTLDAFLESKDIFNDFINHNDLPIYTITLLTNIVDKYIMLLTNHVLNHNCFKLSDFDMEIIRQLPQGGNWKCLSQETIDKSVRLTKLQNKNCGTTFYGRLDWQKLSYTLTTYFNRPCSGTNAHPSNDRVISCREAARIQGFPDTHYFYGNQRDILMQIGNAVPPIFSYQLAKSICDKVDCKTSIDLFCGAGGFNIGFEKYGIKSILSNDINSKACTTLKTNFPNINVLCGDITLNETKEEIYNIGKKQPIDIIVGGPPCQGYSFAGKRDENDERNQLFNHYLDVVEHINPKVIVFENVLGLLAYKKGETIQEIIKGFGSIGYDVEMKPISMNEYLVPQKRKRVIIIGTRKDLKVNPIDLFPVPISIDKNITMEDAIFDLKDCDFYENATYNEEKTSSYVQYLKNEITFDDFVNFYLNKTKERND